MKPYIRLALLTVLAILAVSGCSRKERNMAINAVNDGIAQYERSNFTGAVAAFERATRADETWGIPYYYLGMVRLHAYASAGAAIDALSMAAELMPDHALTFYQLGIAHRLQGNLEEAQEAFERAVELDPEHEEAHYRLGGLLEASGDIIAAIEAYTHSIYANPRFANPYADLGSIYVRYEFFEEATLVFQNGFDNTGDESLAHLLGGMYLRAGRIDRAITYFEEALASESESTIFNYAIGVAYAHWFLESFNPTHQELATEHLNIAARRCGEHGSRARCNSIQRVIEEMAEAVESQTPQP